jgi:hypothetical protein
MDIQVTHITVNRRGQPQRDQQRIAGPTVIIGRGTQCQIHLPDPRIALQHAQIAVSESEATISAEAGRIQVNGRAVEGAKLAIGDQVEVGPYLLEVESPPAGIPLAVSVRLVLPLASFGGDGRRFLLQAPRLSKRRLSYIAFLGTLLLCLLVPAAPSLLGYPTMTSVSGAAQSDHELVSKVAERFLQSWNPGPLSQAHQVIASDCRACHQFPFVQVRDLSCVGCHKQIAAHVLPAAAPAAQAAHPSASHPSSDEVYGRCTSCHRDHKGGQMAPHAQDECANCHRDVTSVVKDAGSGRATDFYYDHPDFRLSLRNANKADNAPDAVRRVRQNDPAAAAELVERSNLKFNHKLHLAQGGIRDRVGKLRDADPQRDKVERGRRVLRCGDCHQPGEGGRLMAPVTMAQHCQECHSLQFEPGAPKREAVHGAPEAVLTGLREFYARLVLGEVPPGVNPPADLRRQRPGAVLTYQERGAALRAADRKASQAFNELFTSQPGKAREVCITCHELTRKGDGAGWQVAPVRVAKEWLPQARFTHAKHATVDCLACHGQVTDSQRSGDIAMPDIKSCRECHVSARPAEHVEDRLASECAMCHSFHFGRQLWFGENQAQMKPRRRK